MISPSFKSTIPVRCAIPYHRTTFPMYGRERTLVHAMSMTCESNSSNSRGIRIFVIMKFAIWDSVSTTNLLLPPTFKSTNPAHSALRKAKLKPQSGLR